MKTKFLIFLFCGLIANYVKAEGNESLEMKGLYPYMAFLYYQDPAIIENGNRFFRSAVIIKPSWLVSAAIDPLKADNADETLGFPDKTLLARAGATDIDEKISLNDDDNEQEREIVQLVRPGNHRRSQYWQTDISLLKTILPFKMTREVAAASLTPKTMLHDMKCFVLMFSNVGLKLQERVLRKFDVVIQAENSDICGSWFYEPTMICSKDSKEMPGDYCKGNSGGPLICENKVAGLQTYINYDCKPPHLYQLLSKWDSFMQCGLEDNCNIKKTCNCTVTNKDTKDNKPEDDSSEEKQTVLLKTRDDVEQADSSETSDEVKPAEKETSDEVKPAEKETSDEVKPAEKESDEVDQAEKQTSDEAMRASKTTDSELYIAEPTSSVLKTTSPVPVLNDEDLVPSVKVEYNDTQTETANGPSTKSAQHGLAENARKNWFSNHLNLRTMPPNTTTTTTTTDNKKIKEKAHSSKHAIPVKRSNANKFDIMREVLIIVSIFVLLK